MKKFFGKIPMIAIAILISVCSVSVTAYAFYALTFEVSVPVIQTADFQTIVSVLTEEVQAVVVLGEEEGSIENYTFSGEEGEDGVTFCIVGAGTASTGYCEIIVGDQTYYTKAINQGESYYLTIKGNAGTAVQFHPHWGMHDGTDEAAIIDAGEVVGTYVSVATPTPTVVPSASPSTSPSASPSAEPSAEPSASPSAEPSAEPSASPSASPSATPSAEPSAEPSASPSAEPSAEPSASPSAVPSPEPSASPSEAPSAEPSASPSAVPSAEPSPEPSASPSEAPSLSAEPSTEPSMSPETTANPEESMSPVPTEAPSTELGVSQ